MNLFIVYKLDTWLRYLNANFTLDDCLFGAVKLTKNTNPHKYGDSAYGIGLVNEVKCCYFTDNRKKPLVIGEGLPDGLDNTTVTVKVKYYQVNKKIV